MKYGVPTAISSDDEGVARSDMTTNICAPFRASICHMRN